MAKFLVKRKTVSKDGTERYYVREIDSNHKILGTSRYASRQGRNARIRTMVKNSKLKYIVMTETEYKDFLKSRAK